MAAGRERPSSAFERRLRGAIRAVAPLLLLVACGEPAALEVGRVGYSASEIALLGPEERADLIDLTAFGLAVSAGDVDSLIEPFVQRELRSLMLQRLAMEVAVDVYSEKPLTGECTATCRALVTLVCVDPDGKPKQVPPLVLESDEERRRASEAVERRETRLASRG